MTHLQLNNVTAHASAWSAKNLDWFSLSSLGSMTGAGGALFANVLGSIGTANSANATTDTPSASDPLSQLQALAQSGTSPSTIASSLASQIISNFQQQYGTLTTAQQTQIRTSIQHLVERELGASPPIKGPPLKAQPKSSGQKNDIAGNILDAKSAKDIPAQAQGKETSSTLDVSSLVRSSIAQALTSLTSAKSGSKSTTSAADATTYAGVQHLPILGGPAITDRVPTTDAPTQHAAPQPSVASPIPALPIADNDNSITMDNAPDLLARMLVRASSTDAKINGNVATATPQAPQTAGASQTPQALAARFEAALATIVSNAVANGSSNASNGQNSNLLDQQLSSQTATPTHDLSNAPVQAVASTAPSFANLVASVAQNAQPQATPIDANAVIEQMMKSMVMRTNDQGASTIRLHLQPENLGDMTMHITVSGSQISANVVTANADVRSTLLSNQQQLARSLQQSGLSLSGFSVDVSGGNAGRDQNRDRTTGFGRRYVVHELHGAPQETPALSTLAPTIMNGSSLELFNYLV